MKATDVIKRDHKAAKDLFEKYKNTSGDEREEVLGKIFKALSAHEKMEDKHFYAPLKDHLKDDEVFKELDAEQQKLEMEAMAIMALEMVAGDREERIKNMMMKVLAHAKREEEEIFPKAENILGADQLEEIGNRMEPESAVAKG